MESDWPPHDTLVSNANDPLTKFLNIFCCPRLYILKVFWWYNIFVVFLVCLVIWFVSPLWTGLLHIQSCIGKNDKDVEVNCLVHCPLFIKTYLFFFGGGA